MTNVVDLAVAGAALLEQAGESHNGRATQLLHTAPDVGLAQVLLAIRAGHELADHENPGEATLHGISGRAQLNAGDDAWSVSAGELLVIPRRRHAVVAEEDFVGLLTIVRSQEGRS
jgi:quercetin dioxygenase-like cupin family protein